MSKETDIALRTFLAERGVKKCDLSRFMEDAVRWQVFQRPVLALVTQEAYSRGPTD